jgi:arginine repressor
MPPQPFDFSPYYADIAEGYGHGLSVKDILKSLKQKYRHQSITVTSRTLHRQIRDWGLVKYKPHKDETILELVKKEWIQNSSHEEILTIINYGRKHPISSNALKKLRINNRIVYARKGEVTEEEEEAQREAITKVLLEGGASYGRGQLMVALRTEGILVPQQVVRRLMKDIDLEGVRSRQIAYKRRKGKMQIAGLGRVYSCDGYDKLKPYGIHIYGFIDGYSRYVTQVYVGIDNKTAVSVLIQYLVMCRKQGRIPRLLRADKGVETPLMAWAHVLLRRAMALASSGS